MDEAIAIRVGQGLRAARLRARLTQAQVAEAFGLAPEAYARMERGKLLPSLPTLVGLCAVLRVSMDEVVGPPGPPH
jgi:transcriptional regulator with XRE-family HTH domain